MREITAEQAGLASKCSKVTDAINSDLYYISKEESRINSKNEFDVKKLKEIAMTKNTYLKEL